MNQTLLPVQPSPAILVGPVSSVLLVEKDDTLRDSRRLVLSRLHPGVQAVDSPVAVFNCAPDAAFRLVVIDMSEPRAAERVAFYARRRWPKAKILLLGTSCGQLDDFLYDDLVDPCCNTAGFLEVSRRLWKSAAPGPYESS